MLALSEFQSVACGSQMAGMQTVSEIRHANLLSLIKQAGSVQAFADQVERSHSQISQLKNRSKHSKTGEPRDVGDDMARHIEGKLGLPTGWMDAPHAEVEAPLAEAPKEGPADGLVDWHTLALQIANSHPDEEKHDLLLDFVEMVRVERERIMQAIAQRAKQHTPNVAKG